MFIADHLFFYSYFTIHVPSITYYEVPSPESGNAIHESQFHLLIAFFIPPYSLFTIHYSLFTIHHSPFTFHYSPFTIHYSLFTIHYSPFTIHYSLFTIHYSLFTIHYPISLFQSIHLQPSKNQLHPKA